MHILLLQKLNIYFVYIGTERNCGPGLKLFRMPIAFKINLFIIVIGQRYRSKKLKKEQFIAEIIFTVGLGCFIKQFTKIC